MIIIFLDINGVLLKQTDRDAFGGISRRLEQRYISQGIPIEQFDFSSKACDAEAVNLFDKSSLENLNSLIEIMEKSGEIVGIVISSSWKQNRSVDDLKKLFLQYFFSKKIIDKTADGLHDTRGEEIAAWLHENREKFNVSNFIILDDVDENLSKLFNKNFIKCNTNFDQKNLQQAIEALASKSSLEIKHSENRSYKIDIAGINKEKIILELFRNVYKKSDEAKSVYSDIMRYTPNQPGIYREPDDFEIGEFLRCNNGRVEFLGCVKFCIDFSGSTIDTEFYDKIHNTGTNNIETAAVIINRLKLQTEDKSPVLKTFGVESFKLRSHNVAPLNHATIELKKDNTNQVINKLNTIFEAKCSLTSILDDCHIVNFSPELPFETLQKYFSMLSNAGLKIKIDPPSSLCGGLIKVPAKVELRCSLVDMINVLDSLSVTLDTSKTRHYA